MSVRTYQGQRVHIIEKDKETKWSHCIAFSAPFIFMIIILLSPELAQMEACLDENPEFFMVRLHFYCCCRHTLRTFHQTGYWMVFNWSSLCSNWQTELQILHPRERLFCLFLLFSFWNWRGENVKKSTLYLSYFPKKNVVTTLCTGLPDAKRQPSHDRQMVDGSCQSPRRRQRRLLHKSHQVRIFVVQLCHS